MRTKPLLLLLSLLLLAPVGAQGQGRGRDDDKRRGVRSVTIPVTVHLPKEREPQEMRSIDVLTVFEDGEQQEILTVRGVAQSPLTLAVLIQDDLTFSVGGEVRGIADFVRHLPAGSRVMVGYLRAGSLQVRQKFTPDLERAAKSLRIPIGSTSGTPYNPYTLLRDAIKRFEGQPVGRRAVLMVSDGLDLSHGFSSSTPSQSLDLQRAIDEAQRKGVAVYSIYSPTVGGTGEGGSALVGNGQGSLNRLAEETGGHAFFQGTSAPVSFKPFLRDLGAMLSRQVALTYLSTHTDKGFHRLKVESDMTEGSIRYPNGYPR
jgi:VWFA-related protein